MTYGLTALQPTILGSQIVMSADDGATIGRRTRISQRDDGNARCRASRAEVGRRGSFPSMQPPTTRSTFNAISFQQGHTELFEPRPWTRGAWPLLQHEHNRQRDRSRLSFDNVTMPDGGVGTFQHPPTTCQNRIMVRTPKTAAFGMRPARGSIGFTVPPPGWTKY